MNDIKPAILFFLLVIILAHFFAVHGYDWTENTISELASQGHDYKWIMQVGFIGFGTFLTVGLIGKSKKQNHFFYPDIDVMVYGLSILMTGFFCAAPINQSISYSIKEAQIHSLFATLAGFALVLGILGYIILSPNKRTFHFIFLILITGISLLFGLSESGMIPIGKGIIQRSLYLVSFIWLYAADEVNKKEKQ
jgi:hypothetical membrane protein